MWEAGSQWGVLATWIWINNLNISTHTVIVVRSEIESRVQELVGVLAQLQRAAIGTFETQKFAAQWISGYC